MSRDSRLYLDDILEVAGRVHVRETVPSGVRVAVDGLTEAERGEIALGGCCVTDRDPRKRCKACGKEFDRPPARRARAAAPPPKGA